MRIQDLQPGDRVLLRNLGVPGKYKLADRWKSQPYVVCKRLPGLPVYQIRPEGSTGPLKTWHRNHLLPLLEAIRITPHQELTSTSTADPGSRPVTRSQSEPLATHGDSEEEMEIGWLWSYNMPEADANCFLHTRERNRGVLRPQAREFVPQNGHSEDANDDPPSVQETEAEDYLSFSEAEVQDVEMPEVELG